MKERPLIVADNRIPFLEGRVEKFADVIYLPGREIGPGDIRQADALIIRTRTRCDAALLEDSKVKFIATATIGMDHIDIQWCEKKGITLCNAAGCNAPAVADYVWGSLLRCGFEPKGKKIGVIGYGHVGQIVARAGEALGCEVLVNDPLRQIAGLTDREYLPLEHVLKESDVVTLHTPLTRDCEHATVGLIGSREIAMMKPGAMLINSARGGIVDEESWIAAIEEKRIEGIVDVWENEADVNRRLLAVVRQATPHIAGYSLNGKKRATEMVIAGVKDFFLGNKAECFFTGESSQKENIFEPVRAEELYRRLIKMGERLEEDSEKLKRKPELFESFRENYNYRDEVLCSI